MWFPFGLVCVTIEVQEQQGQQDATDVREEPSARVAPTVIPTRHIDSEPRPRGHAIDEELEDLGLRQKALPPDRPAETLQREVIVHEDVDQGVLETCDPSKVHFTSNLNPACSHDEDVMKDVQKGERPLSKDQEDRIEQLVKFAQVEPDAPSQETSVPFFVPCPAIEGERTVII